MASTPSALKLAEPAGPDTYKHYSYILLILLGVLYLWGHGLYGLFDVDEAIFTQTSIEMVTTGDYIAPTYNAEPRWHKPPLSYWLQAASLQLFNAMPYQENLTPLAARLPSAIIMWLATYFFFRFVSSTTHNNRLALTATAILGANMLWFLPARAAIADAVLNFSIITSTLLALHLLYRRKLSPVYQTLIGLLLAVGVLAKGPIALVIPGLTVGLTILMKPYFLESLRILNPFYILTGLLLGIMPWVLLILNHQGTGFFEEFILVHNLERFTSDLGNSHSGSPFYYLLVLLIGFFPWSVLLLPAIPATHRKMGDDMKSMKPERAMPLVGLIWLLVVLVLFSFSQTKLIHYIIPALPGAALILAVWAESLEGARHVKKLGILLSVIFGVIFLSLNRLLIAARPDMTDPLLESFGITWPPSDPFTQNVLAQVVQLNLAPYGIAALLTIGGITGFWILSKRCRSGLWVLILSQLGAMSLLVAGVAPVADQYLQQPLRQLAQHMAAEAQPDAHIIHYKVHRPSVRLVSGLPFTDIHGKDALIQAISRQQTLILTEKHLVSGIEEDLPQDRDIAQTCRGAFCVLTIPAVSAKTPAEEEKEAAEPHDDQNSTKTEKTDA